jgi:hypothetical protein
MKEILKYSLPIFFAGAFILIIINKCSSDCPPKGFVLMSQSTIDSINAIANSKPDTVWKRDTVFPPAEIVWKDREVPVPERKDSLKPYFAKDSLVNKDLAIYINDSTWHKDFIFKRTIGYKLFVPKEITNTVTITEKVPILIPEVPKKWYVSGGIGVGDKFIFSGEFGYLKNNRNYGVEYERFGSTNIIKVKTGFKF